MTAETDPDWKKRGSADKDGPDFWYARAPR
jgi:hypothetical protein